MTNLTRRRVLMAVAAVAGMALLFGLAILLGLESLFMDEGKPERLVLSETRFEDLAGWAEDDHAAALAAFGQSCTILERLPAARSLRGDPQLLVTAGDLQPACEKARNTASQDARSFFETTFTPFRIRNESGGDDTDLGLITGYYEPEMKGSRTKTQTFTSPVLARPADLVSVDLGDFRDALRGQRIAGRVVDGHLVPYEDRAAIVSGALDPHALELIWLADPVDNFFLQIQGSGRVVLVGGPDDGKVIRLSYAGQNGHPYTAIGRPLIDRGHIPRAAMSMAAIREWLEANPDGAQEVMNLNASFVFFTELEVEHPELGPPGAQSALLTPGRSLAVDRSHHALGLPMWFELENPSAAATDGPLRRLMVAQDTGGAIRGPVRADFFAGTGDQAGAIAGQMQDQGALTLLLPIEVAARARNIKW